MPILKSLRLFIFCMVVHGFCSAQSNLNVQFRSQLPYGSNVDLANIWGYVDSLGNEYALVGAQTGLSIVDVTNPSNPVQKFFVPGTNSFWREVQVWGKYAYVTTEGCCNGLQIVDLSKLPASVNSRFWTGTGSVAGAVGRIHSIHIRDGFAYLNGSQLFGGATLIVSLADPWNPVYLGNTQMSLSGNQRYVHDCFVRNDTLWGAHIYAGFFSVINISNKAAPVLINTQNTPGNFTHNVWMPDNGRGLLFTTDEVSNSYLASYDVTNTGNITFLDRLQGTPGSGSIIHNTCIRNNYAINSYYKDGITIVDVSRPDNLITIGRYDTYTQGAGNGFNGAWGVYPFLPSGNILVSDIDNGLFVLTPSYNRACYLEGMVRDSCTGLLLYNTTVTITGGTHHAELSKLNGIYKTGTALQGVYDVVFTKTGYQALTVKNVYLQNGVLTALDVKLIPMNVVSPSVSSVYQVKCHGGNDGWVDLNVTGGNPPVTYSWSNGATTQDLLSLPAGFYSVTVTDGTGCFFVKSFSVTEPAPFIVSGSAGSPSCDTASDGVVTVVVIGGLGPYSLQIGGVSVSDYYGQAMFRKLSSSLEQAEIILYSGPGDTLQAGGFSAGQYPLVVTDVNGCVFTTSVTVPPAPNPCIINISMRLFVEGFYLSNGSMQAVSGGDPSQTDTLLLELHEINPPYALVDFSKGVLDTSGWVNFSFSASLWQQSVYLVVKHRNAVETWSKSPLHLPSGSHNFIWTGNSVVPVYVRKQVAVH